MKVTYQLGEYGLSVDGVTMAELGHVLDMMGEDRNAAVAPVVDFGTGKGRVNGSTGDLFPYEGDLDSLVTTGGSGVIFIDPSGAPERQHLEPPDLDDDDSLARMAFNAYMTATDQSLKLTFDDSAQPGWRAAAAVVRAATLLARADRMAAQA